ncbi:MAG: UDP-N-acetylglucosamine 1-carboxyvinyltransferase [Desulfohalobiaceae bacterium]|nr:UDP-N-acetylglucosamine 1-carboxyvinyltransferase [Desulfohalobiaceae bacterium]
MDELIIQGGKPLSGKVRISGSKNAALPILLGSMLVPGEVVISGLPELQDVGTTIELLTLFGCSCRREGDSVSIVAGSGLKPEAPYDLVRTMRASVLCLGPLLARLGRARVALPGGCAIGSRPIDMHLRSLEKLGASFDLDSGDILGHCERLRGAHVVFDFPTVGGTENMLLAAVLAEGETILENAAREPEVSDLAEFLNACGARISGQGTSLIRIKGVESLRNCRYTVMPDRIEAGTYMAAAGISGGDLQLENCPDWALDTVIAKFREMGLEVEAGESVTRVRSSPDLACIDIVTQPYPGFPTDMQAQFMALMCVASGSGMIQETIFENRFLHALELMRLGAQIKISGDTALIRGERRLIGAPVQASDLRASASLVLAGLAARGTTTVRRIYHLDRGYERMEDKLAQVGARIRRKK